MTPALLCVSEFLGQMDGTGELHWSVQEDIKFSQEVKIEWKAPQVKAPYVTAKINSAPTWWHGCVCVISSVETAPNWIASKSYVVFISKNSDYVWADNADASQSNGYLKPRCVSPAVLSHRIAALEDQKIMYCLPS